MEELYNELIEHINTTAEPFVLLVVVLLVPFMVIYLIVM